MRKLPGEKIVLSNGPTHYVEDILCRMGVAHCFSAAFGMERLRYRPKPHAQAYWSVLARHRLNPRHCIMVEDSLENLRAAKVLGMKTVWIARARQRPSFVDARITRLNQLLRLPQLAAPMP
jgi:putative hydrolase of the HAD superfamily